MLKSKQPILKADYAIIKRINVYKLIQYLNIIIIIIIYLSKNNYFVKQKVTIKK